MKMPGADAISHDEGHLTDDLQKDMTPDYLSVESLPSVDTVVDDTSVSLGSVSIVNESSKLADVKDIQLSTSVAVTRTPEILTVDSIEITYDLANKNYDYYKQKTENKHSKVLKLLALIVSVLLFGLQAPYPSPFSCFITSTLKVSGEKLNECDVNYVQLLSILIMAATELIVLLPLYTKPVIVSTVRMIQIACLMLIKIQIHHNLRYENGEAVNFGYVGYIFLCGCIVACFTTEIPGKEKRVRKFHATLISAITAVALVVEIGLNTYQTILLSDMLIGFISVGVFYFTAGVVIYAFKIWKQYGQAFKFLVFYFVVGHIALMYLTLPSLHFQQLIIQIGLYSASLTVYTIIFVTHQYFRFH